MITTVSISQFLSLYFLSLTLFSAHSAPSAPTSQLSLGRDNLSHAPDSVVITKS